MKKQELANAFDLLEPTQEVKYNVRNIINTKKEGRKPFFKRFKRPALAVTCFALASLLVITAAAAGGVQLFSLIYGPDISEYGEYITKPSASVSTQNVTFTLEGMIHDGCIGKAMISLKALTDEGKALIGQFNEDINNRANNELRTGNYFYWEEPDYLREICSNHLFVSSDKDMVELGLMFSIRGVTDGFNNGKNYYMISWGTNLREEASLEIGWTDNGETVTTPFDLSVAVSSITIDCSGIEPAYPESFNVTKITVSAIGVTIYTLSDKNYAQEIFHEKGHGFGQKMFDDCILMKFTDGRIYDLFGTNQGEYETLPITEENVCNGTDRMHGSDIEKDDGDVDYYYEFYKGFYDLTDINTVESIIIFGVEYKLHED
ncbi:MAG TPA: hypothetical protein PK629_10570 [Oscillospiraceae bacterium]|nr:hypothetical protein [Oscillospiraceae bacterium]HPF56788.1 hypothetical protein [Clostridiales bacterium]HPK35766.1 hypothetical protein [Oscillospiraceae bacterium]HPR75386.1 hypothetical protein [Oscillospiraceae bacterium]